MVVNEQVAEPSANHAHQRGSAAKDPELNIATPSPMPLATISLRVESIAPSKPARSTRVPGRFAGLKAPRREATRKRLDHPPDQPAEQDRDRPQRRRGPA